MEWYVRDVWIQFHCQYRNQTSHRVQGTSVVALRELVQSSGDDRCLLHSLADRSAKRDRCPVGRGRVGGERAERGGGREGGEGGGRERGGRGERGWRLV